MKNKSVAIVLALFLGGLGLHKFYLGQNFIGLLYLIFSWTFIPMILGGLEALCYMTYSEKRWNKAYNPIMTKLMELQEEKRAAA